jgi:hypothetical protein
MCTEKTDFEEGKELIEIWLQNLDKFTAFERQGLFSIISAKIGFVDVTSMSDRRNLQRYMEDEFKQALEKKEAASP